MVLGTVGKGMVTSVGLLNQLQRQSSRDLVKKVERSNGRAGGKFGNTGGSLDRNQSADRPASMDYRVTTRHDIPRSRREVRMPPGGHTRGMG